MFFGYHLAWLLIFLGLLPAAALLRGRRWRQRLALELPTDPLPAGTVWVHALSVGEVLSAIPLVDRLGARYPERTVVFSSTTVRGLEIARTHLRGLKRPPVTLPVDFIWCNRRLVRRLRPAIMVLVESDIWPGLTRFLRQEGIPLVLVNGRVSPRTFRRYRRARALAAALFAPFTRCLMQTGLDRERLLACGVPERKVLTAGNIKFDRAWQELTPEDRNRWQETLGIDPGSPIWVAGSTHPGEDDAVLRVLARLKADFPGLKLILAPRDVTRGNAILVAAQRLALRAVLRTDAAKPGKSWDVLVLNTLGELGQIYGLATMAFVGGSLVPVGGHNLLEPASFGCPVLYGPHTHNFVEMAASLAAAGGGREVADEEALYAVLRHLLGQPRECEALGLAARRFVTANQGALERVLAVIATLLPPNKGT